MRRSLFFFLLTVLFSGGARNVFAQQADSAFHLFRISEDDDSINPWGTGTDNAYTNGIRLDYFYMPSRPSRFFIDKALPRAGAGSINTYGWGVTQIMYTPDDISTAAYQPNDYPYSGAIYATHTLYSYNPIKKYDLKSEWVLGVIGPASLADQTQTLVHRLTGYDLPKGWSHQYRNDLLLNFNITVEKQLAQAGKTLEIIGGSQAWLGTMQNGISLYPLIRIGRLTPYFNGLFSQYTGTVQDRKGKKKGQLYFFLKPEARLVLSNAILQGGVFTKNPNLLPATESSKPTPAAQAIDSADAPPPKLPLPYHRINTIVSSLTYGAVYTNTHWGISFSQNIASAEMKNLYCHTTGNVSLYFSW